MAASGEEFAPLKYRTNRMVLKVRNLGRSGCQTRDCYFAMASVYDNMMVMDLVIARPEIVVGFKDKRFQPGD